MSDIILAQARQLVAQHKLYSRLSPEKQAATAERLAKQELLRRHCELYGRRLMADGSTRPLHEPEPSEEEIAAAERAAEKSWKRAVKAKEERRRRQAELAEQVAPLPQRPVRYIFPR